MLNCLQSVLFGLILDVGEASARAVLEWFEFAWLNVAELAKLIKEFSLSDILIYVFDENVRLLLKLSLLHLHWKNNGVAINIAVVHFIQTT